MNLFGAGKSCAGENGGTQVKEMWLGDRRLLGISRDGRVARVGARIVGSYGLGMPKLKPGQSAVRHDVVWVGMYPPNVGVEIPCKDFLIIEPLDTNERDLIRALNAEGRERCNVFQDRQLRNPRLMVGGNPVPLVRGTFSTFELETDRL